ncbi:tail fiber domain-containing protein [bacterium]|nr:tail fiber domain-containing protein [bacterium]
MKITTLLTIGIGIAMVTTATAQLKVLQNGNTIIGGGNSSFPYSQTKLSVNGSTSLKSSLEIMNLNNSNVGWGGQIRFTPNDLSGINHIIADNGAHEMILFPGYSQSNSALRRVTLYGGLSVYGYSYLAGGAYFSDKNLKENVTKLEGSLEKVMKLQGVYFNWKRQIIKKTGDKEVNIAEGLPKGRQLGFIAQEVEQVIPEIVHSAKDGYKSLEYHTMTALLVEAIKEQQSQIRLLEEKISGLNNKMEEDLDNPNKNSEDTISLSQNIPNPFGIHTQIKYSLPNSYGSGNLLISDLSGKEIITLLLKPGTNQILDISSDRLQNGIYLYSIVVNGKVRVTKRFVVSK